jgi:hypothetical protein
MPLKNRAEPRRMKMKVNLTVAATSSCTYTVDSRIGRAATDNLERIANLFEGGCKLQQWLQLVFLTQLRAQLSSRQTIVWPDTNHRLSHLAGLNRDRIPQNPKTKGAHPLVRRSVTLTPGRARVVSQPGPTWIRLRGAGVDHAAS